MSLSDPQQAINPVDKPISANSGEQATAASIQPSSRADRIVAVCPHCQATLSIRRVYLGKEVRCKQCAQLFPLRADEDLEAKPNEPVRQRTSAPTAESLTVERDDRLKKEHERLLGEHVKFLAAHGQLQSTVDRLEADYNQVNAARHQLQEQANRVTNELTEIRADLGTIASCDVQALAQERESLRTQVDRLEDQNRGLRVDQAASAHLAADLERRGVELNSARRELDLHVQQLGERNLALDAAHAESRRLNAVNQDYERLLDVHAKLLAAHGQLQSTLERLEAEHDQFDAARQKLEEHASRVTNELNEIRADLGPIASCDVRSLAQECESLRAQVNRLENQNRELRDDQAASAHLAADLERRGVELNTARGELDRHVQQLEERHLALDAAHAETRRLSTVNQNLSEEIEALQATLAQRDRSLSEQSDELRAQFEAHQSALSHLESVHREAIGLVQDEHRSTDVRYKDCEDRILELAESHERLKSDYQSMLEAEQAKQNKLATELFELRATSEETARVAAQLISENASPSEAHTTPDPELEAARAQIDELKQSLTELKQLNLDLSKVLANLGLHFDIPIKN